MTRLSHEAWYRMNAIALDLHRAADTETFLGVLRDSLPGLLGRDCRVAYDDGDAGNGGGEGRFALGPFALVCRGTLPKAGETLLRLLAEHAETAWAGTARPEVVARCHPAYGDLTRRQREVLPLLLRGLSNAEIGRELCISPRTVEKHVAALRRVLGVRRGNGVVQTGGRRLRSGEKNVNT